MSKNNWTQNNLYKELPSDDGCSILFRKFDTGMYIVQFNDKGEQIGVVRLNLQNLEDIYNAPCIKAGDGKSPQLLKGDLH